MAPLARLHRMLARLLPDYLLFYPFEIFTVLLCLAAGPQLLLVGPDLDSAARRLPGWITLLWGWNLIVGALLTLVGLIIRRLPVEAAGLLLLGVSALLYAAVTLIFAGLEGVAEVAFVALFTMACFARRYSISSALDINRHAATHAAEQAE